MISPVLASDDAFQVVFILVIVFITVVNWIIQTVKKSASKMRQRSMDGTKGLQPMPMNQPQRQQTMQQPQAARPQRPVQSPPPRPATGGSGDLMGDLESILRDQLGLDIEKRQPARPAQQQTPPRPMQPTPARPTHQPQMQPSRPTRPARPGTAPSRTSQPVPIPAPRPPDVPRRAARSVSDVQQRADSAYDIKAKSPYMTDAERSSTPRATPKRPQVDPAAARAARHHYEVDKKRKVSTDQSVTASRLRTALKGPSVRQAIVMAEILNPPSWMQDRR